VIDYLLADGLREGRCPAGRLMSSIVVQLKLVGFAAGAGVAVTAALAVSPASASSLKTIKVPSHCVDPRAVVMSEPPAGKAARPPALRVNVRLPDGYDRRERFPVLYLLHGLGGAYDYWAEASYGEFAEAVRDLRAIVVMPEGGTIAQYGNFWADGKRRPCWERYYLDELVPKIERRFRIRGGRRWHAIGGFSSGGQGAILHGVRRPDYFGQLLSLSGVLNIQTPEVESGVTPPVIAAVYAPTRLSQLGPSYFFDAFGDPQAQRFYWAGHNPTELASGLSASRVYVAHGGPTFPTCVEIQRPVERCAGQELLGGALIETNLREQAATFMRAARDAGADLTYRPRDGGHFYNYAARQLGDAIDHWGLFKPVPRPPDRWTYKTVSQRGRMWDLRFRFADPPQSLETFVRRGRTLRGYGTGRVRLRGDSGQSFKATLPFKRRLSR
jgi:S-formylglutathione hydrolase FrmB